MKRCCSIPGCYAVAVVRQPNLCAAHVLAWAKRLESEVAQ
jgi:hypothetical protein